MSGIYVDCRSRQNHCFLFSFSFQQDGYVFLWPYNANLLVIRHFRIDPAATFVFFLDHVSK